MLNFEKRIPLTLKVKKVRKKEFFKFGRLKIIYTYYIL